MRILIERCGSGWGGYEGKYLVDTKEKKVIDIWKSYLKIKAEVYLDVGKCIRLPLDSFPEIYTNQLDFDVHDLEFFLPTAEIEIDNTICFDQQVDYAYYLAENGQVICILDTSGNGENRYLENTQLAKKLRDLVEVVSHDKF